MGRAWWKFRSTLGIVVTIILLSLVILPLFAGCIAGCLAGCPRVIYIVQQ